MSFLAHCKMFLLLERMWSLWPSALAKDPACWHIFAPNFCAHPRRMHLDMEFEVREIDKIDEYSLMNASASIGSQASTVETPLPILYRLSNEA